MRTASFTLALPIASVQTLLTLVIAIVLAGLAGAVRASEPVPDRVVFLGEALDGELRARLERSDFVRSIGRPEADAVERERLAREAPRQLADILATAGYFSPTIAIRRTTEAWQVQIDPGRRARIATVDLALSGDTTEQAAHVLLERLRLRWPLAPGEAFDDDRWRQGKSSLEAEFRAAGFADARIENSAAMVDAIQAEVALRVAIHPGPLYRFEGLAIRGLHRLPRELVERLNPLALGEPLTSDALARLEARLRATGLLSGVAVLLDRGAGTRPRAMLEVALTEAPEHRLLLGPGYSSVSGLRLTAEHRWLRLPGLPAQSRTRITWARDEGSLAADVTSYPLRDDWQAVGSVSVGRSELSGLTLDRRRLRVGLERALGDERARQLYAIEWLESAVRAPAAFLSGSALVLDVERAHDTLDDRAFPTVGEAWSFDLGLGVTTRGERRPFVRAVVRASRFWPMANGGFVQGRLEVGQIVGARTARIPQDALFRAGGDGSVRGYGNDGLGVAGPGYVAGGRFLATGTAEYAHPLRDRLYGTLFIDAGGASERLSRLRPVASFGAGVRWASPIGALSAHVAWAEARRKLSLGFTVGVRF